MFTRLTGWFIVPVWLLAMSWVVSHDVWPGWTADDPPPLQTSAWLKDAGNRTQYTIEDRFGKLGTIWTTYMLDEDVARRTDLIWLERAPIIAAPIRMVVELSYTADGVLDEFTFRLHSPETRMRLHGERFHSDFSFTFSMGSNTNDDRVFKVPLTDGQMIAAAFNPFSNLSNLHVGQRWRMQVFNPLSAIAGVGNKFSSILVEVTGQETVVFGGQAVACMVVQAADAKAWVDSQGVVWRQELTIPMIGKLRISHDAVFNNTMRLKRFRESFLEKRN